VNPPGRSPARRFVLLFGIVLLLGGVFLMSLRLAGPDHADRPFRGWLVTFAGGRSSALS